MPKITLEFTTPEEQEDLWDALRGSSWRFSLKEIDEHLRSRIKHGELDDNVAAELQSLRTFITDVLESKGLYLYE